MTVAMAVAVAVDVAYTTNISLKFFQKGPPADKIVLTEMLWSSFRYFFRSKANPKVCDTKTRWGWPG